MMEKLKYSLIFRRQINNPYIDIIRILKLGCQPFKIIYLEKIYYILKLNFNCIYFCERTQMVNQKKVTLKYIQNRGILL